MEVVAQAVGLFAITNVDDIVLVTLFFGQGGGRAHALGVVAGQYLGFAAILVASVVVGLGVGSAFEDLVPYLGLVPLVLGVRAAIALWRERRDGADGDGGEPVREALGVTGIAGVTAANGGDNIGVYVPVFAGMGAGDLTVTVVTFLALVAVWCVAGLFLARRPPVARALARWGHVLVPVVLVAIGVVILVEGGAFGL